jgi:hypothetical protein
MLRRLLLIPPALVMAVAWQRQRRLDELRRASRPTEAFDPFAETSTTAVGGRGGDERTSTQAYCYWWWCEWDHDGVVRDVDGRQSGCA